MKNKRIFRGWWLSALCVLGTATWLAGCQSTGSQAWEELRAGRYQNFQTNLTLTTEAINAGELAQAREHLKGTERLASSAAQRRKVQSLEQLIDGAEALRDGDPDKARIAWAQIEEPRLRREVRHKARLIGMDVPRTPSEIEATQ